MVRLLQWMAGCFAVLSALFLAGSYGGAIHGLGDSLAVVRMPLAVFTALAAIWTGWSAWIRWPIAGLCLLILASVVVQKQAGTGQAVSGQAGPLVIYQKNLFVDNAEVPAVLADILARKPDVVTLQEVSDSNSALLEALRPQYPHQLLCSYPGLSSIALLSRLPPQGDTICSDQRSFAAMRVQTGQGPVWVLSLHLFWPWPYGQKAQVAGIVPILEGLDRPVVLSGDFNMVPWANSVAQLQKASGTQRAGPLRPTFQLLQVPLPIDHVMASGGGDAEVLPYLGSDHRGVLARVVTHVD